MKDQLTDHHSMQMNRKALWKVQKVQRGPNARLSGSENGTYGRTQKGKRIGGISGGISGAKTLMERIGSKPTKAGSGGGLQVMNQLMSY